MLVSNNLKCESRKRLVILRLTQSFFFTLCMYNCRYVKRRRKEINNGIQKTLNTLILERRSAVDRNNRTGHCCLSYNKTNLFLRKVSLCKKFLEKSIILFSTFLDKNRSPLFHIFQKISRNFFFNKC